MSGRRGYVLAGTICAIVVGASTFLWAWSRAQAGPLGPDGPTLTVGAPSLVSGKVQFQVSTTGSVPNSYAGSNLHIRWDATVFSFSSANATGSLFDPGASLGFCPAPVPDGDGGGVLFACTGFNATSNLGLLATFNLTPVGTGCSTIHLFTFGPPDNGDSTTGSYTIDGATFSPQQNIYADGNTDTSGSACSAVTSTPTGAANTSTSTPVPAGTSTPAATTTSTPPPTSTVVVSTNTPAATPTAPEATSTPVGPTTTAVPTNTGTQVPTNTESATPTAVVVTSTPPPTTTTATPPPTDTPGAGVTVTPEHCHGRGHEGDHDDDHGHGRGDDEHCCNSAPADEHHGIAALGDVIAALSTLASPSSGVDMNRDDVGHLQDVLNSLSSKPCKHDDDDDQGDDDD